MKWGCQELWTDNFDVLLFVECRTLNRFVLKLLLHIINQKMKKNVLNEFPFSKIIAKL